jgi:hypothetical protein
MDQEFLHRTVAHSPFLRIVEGSASVFAKLSLNAFVSAHHNHS